MLDKHFILLFILFNSESMSKKVDLSPKSKASVEESSSLELTCNISLVSTWKSLIFRSSMYYGNNIALVNYGSCEYLSGLDNATLKSKYSLACDFENQIFSLKISNVSLSEHNTSIDCIVNIEGCNKQNDTTVIYVTVPLKSVNITSSSLTIHKHDVKQLYCQTSKSRPLAKVNMFKLVPGHDQPIALQPNSSSYNRSKTDMLATSVTSFNYVADSSDNGGVLFCKASNDISEVRSHNVTLNILYAATIKTIQESDTKDVSGSKIHNISCTMNGNPLPNITWLGEDNSTVLQTEYEVASSSYIINKTKNYCGNKVYICLADNGIGNSVQKEINVTNNSCGGGTEKPNSSSFWISVGFATITLLTAMFLILCIAVMRNRRQLSKASNEEIMMNNIEIMKENPDSNRDMYTENTLYESNFLIVSPPKVNEPQVEHQVSSIDKGLAFAQSTDNAKLEHNTSEMVGVNLEQTVIKDTFEPADGDCSAETIQKEENNENRDNKQETSNQTDVPIVQPRRVQKMKTTVDPEIRKKIVNSIDLKKQIHSSNNTESCTQDDAKPILIYRNKHTGNLQVLDVKPILFVHSLAKTNSGPENSENLIKGNEGNFQELGSNFRDYCQKNEELDAKSSILPIQQNYVELDLSTNNRHEIHRKDADTLYSDVKLRIL